MSAALIPLAAVGDGETILVRLGEGADANVVASVDNFGTALAWAARCNHPETIGLLVSRGADVNQRFRFSVGASGFNQSSALLWATRFGADDAAFTLLGLGADPNAREVSFAHDGQTATGAPPILLVENGALLRRLLEAGADANLRGDDGQTALMRAVRERDAERVRVLLDFGADPSLRDATGASAIDLARQIDASDISDLFEHNE